MVLQRASWSAPVAEKPARPSTALPVARPWLPPADQLLPYLRSIDEARWYSNFGPLAVSLENRFAARLAPPAGVVSTANGTLALTLALKAAANGREGLCAIPAWTFAATPHAALAAGLTPWFVDVDPETWMLEAEGLSRVLAGAPGPVVAAVPVAAYGRLPDLDAWKTLRDETGLTVVLDAAAAFDSLTDAAIPAAVSLHATKVLGVGEGGFVAAEDAELLRRVRELSSFGFRGSREAQMPAGNAKLSEYAAAVGHAGLDGWPAARMRYMLAAQRLRIALIDHPRVRFQPGWGSEWISSTCVVGLPDGAAARTAARLKAEGVDTRQWWGDGCHLTPAFAGLPRADLGNTERLAASTLGLPFAIDLEPREIGRIAGALIGALGGL